MENKLKNKEVYKYNMSLYYQSTIIYFLVFVLYVAVRGQFVEGAFKLVFDPIVYFFILILFIAIAAVLYNLYLNKKLEIDEDAIAFTDRQKSKKYAVKDILFIKIAKDRNYLSSSAFKLIRIKLKNRRGQLIIRPHDYENEKILVNSFVQLKSKLESKNV